MPDKRVMDRRVQKTKALLHEALASLIHEKNYDSIVIKEILDRANVGRSTFYTHFRDKDELLVSGMHDLLRSVRSARMPASARRHEKLLWFSLPMFEHIGHHWRAGEGRAGEARMGAKGRAVIHEHLQRVLAEMIADEVRKDAQGRRKTAGPVPTDLLVQYVASTFILVVNWWVESRSRIAPKEIDDVFRRLILPTLAATAE
jgi:AcrR family transcriptional regulator